MSIASMSDAIDRILPFDLPPLLYEVVAHPIAQVALQLDSILGDGAARPAGALQLLCQLFQKLIIIRKVVHDRHGLAAAPLLFHAELGDDATWNRLGSVAFAALAVFCGPPASRADLADPG